MTLAWLINQNAVGKIHNNDFSMAFPHLFALGELAVLQLPHLVAGMKLWNDVN